jgi:hypothetical protein
VQYAVDHLFHNKAFKSSASPSIQDPKSRKPLFFLGAFCSATLLLCVVFFIFKYTEFLIREKEMALEAAVFQQDWFGHSSKELYNLLGGNWSYDFGLDQNEEDQDNSCSSYFLENQTETFLHEDWNSFQPPNSMVPHLNDLHLTCSNNIPSSSDASIDAANGLLSTAPPTGDHHHHLGDSSTMPATRVKRRRSRSKKNKEEIENQRMTHIAVERNRRKQMNEYLSVLRALMPESYVQRVSLISLSSSFSCLVSSLDNFRVWPAKFLSLKQ